MIFIILREVKIKKIREYNEKELREQVLIPLFMKMGFTDVIENHHSNEKGKDIIFKEKDKVFGGYIYTSVIVKKGDITGSSSTSQSIFNIINQVEQSINETYVHIYDVKEVKISNFIIVTNGKIKPTALEVVKNTLANKRIDILTRQIIDGEKLVDLIDIHYDEFWEFDQMKYETIKSERDRLLENIEKLLSVICINNDEVNFVRDKKCLKDLDIYINKYSSNRKYVFDLQGTVANLEEVDDYYLDDIPNTYGDILSEFVKFKRTVEKILMSNLEITYYLESILTEKDPLKIKDILDDLFFDYASGRNFGFLNDIYNDSNCIDEFKFYRYKKEKLEADKTISLIDIIKCDISKKMDNKISFEDLKIRSGIGYKVKIYDLFFNGRRRFESELYFIENYDEKPYNGIFESCYIFIDNENFLCIEIEINEEKPLEFIENYKRIVYENIFYVLSNVFEGDLSYEIK